MENTQRDLKKQLEEVISFFSTHYDLWEGMLFSRVLTVAELREIFSAFRVSPSTPLIFLTDEQDYAGAEESLDPEKDAIWVYGSDAGAVATALSYRSNTSLIDVGDYLRFFTQFSDTLCCIVYAPSSRESYEYLAFSNGKIGRVVLYASTEDMQGNDLDVPIWSICDEAKIWIELGK